MFKRSYTPPPLEEGIVASIEAIFEEYGARVVECDDCEEQAVRFAKDVERDKCPRCGAWSDSIDWGEDDPDVVEEVEVDDGRVRHTKRLDE